MNVKEYVLLIGLGASEIGGMFTLTVMLINKKIVKDAPIR
jgi:hypothetical protein